MPLRRDDDPQRLLSPTARTPRALCLTLQAALPTPPTAEDEDVVAAELLGSLADRDGDARVSYVTDLRRPS